MLPQPLHLFPTDIAKIFKAHDTNKDETLSLVEFRTWLSSYMHGTFHTYLAELSADPRCARVGICMTLRHFTHTRVYSHIYQQAGTTFITVLMKNLMFLIHTPNPPSVAGSSSQAPSPSAERKVRPPSCPRSRSLCRWSSKQRRSAICFSEASRTSWPC